MRNHFRQDKKIFFPPSSDRLIAQKRIYSSILFWKYYLCNYISTDSQADLLIFLQLKTEILGENFAITLVYKNLSFIRQKGKCSRGTNYYIIEKNAFPHIDLR